MISSILIHFFLNYWVLYVRSIFKEKLSGVWLVLNANHSAMIRINSNRQWESSDHILCQWLVISFRLFVRVLWSILYNILPIKEMHRRVNEIHNNTVYKTPEKKQPVPRDYSPGKKPPMDLLAQENPLPKLKLFWRERFFNSFSTAALDFNESVIIGKKLAKPHKPRRSTM